MPWKESLKMDQKREFVMQSLNHPNFRQLCREYGISAKTGYKWRERFLASGLDGLEEQSRRPLHPARELPEQVVCEIVRIQQAHPSWGPRKIRILYQRKHRGQSPSESSFKRVLDRAGFVLHRRLRPHGLTGRLAKGRVASAPNQVWTVDFKGWWKDRNGLRVEPLTVRDEYSRMILEVRAVENSSTDTVKAAFERLFRLYGLPEAIRSDNGAPFAATNALLGLSRLSAWWLALGIDLERGRPGRPQDNGAHERMHKDIRRELESGRLGRDQQAFDLWREEFNTVRPHETLGMKVPADIYRPSDRQYEGTPDDIDYGNMSTRRVKRSTGSISYQDQDIMLTTALGGWSVGLAHLSSGLVEVWFASLLLGHIDPKTSGFRGAPWGPPEAHQNHPKTCNP